MVQSNGYSIYPEVKGLHTELSRLPNNPIITPNETNWWESKQTFNPGAVVIEGRIHLLYRAIGEDYVSRLGYAMSLDGRTISHRSRSPVYEHNLSLGGIPHESLAPSGGGRYGSEDPRLVVIEDRVYMTYTLYDGYNIRVAVTSISREDFLSGRWKWDVGRIISPEGEKHKNWVIFPKKFDGKFAVLHSLSPRIQIAYLDDLASATIRSEFDGGYAMGRKGMWDAVIRGAAAPPLETREGWLLLYHGSPVREVGGYRLGAMLLDLSYPETVIGRSREPILVPREWYEFAGFKPGVIYATAAVLVGQFLYVYYGASDSYVCGAYMKIDDLLSDLVNR